MSDGGRVNSKLTNSFSPDSGNFGEPVHCNSKNQCFFKNFNSVLQMFVSFALTRPGNLRGTSGDSKSFSWSLGVLEETHIFVFALEKRVTFQSLCKKVKSLLSKGIFLMI